MLSIRMLRFFLVAVFAAAPALAQGGTDGSDIKVPPEVDQALRERLREFNDLQVKGQFRKAESFVAEDTKDYYYNAGKPKYKSLEVVNVEYFENFTHAKVLIATERYISAPPFPQDVPIKGRFVSLWKIENGLWCYYEDQNAVRKNPFGGGGVVRTAPPGMPTEARPPAMPSSFPTSASFAMNMVKADKESVVLKPGARVAVSFLNNAPGQMTLAIDEKPVDLEAALDRKEIPAGQKAVLTLKAKKGLKPGVIKVRVVQTTEVIAIQVSLK